jgi:predicted DNA-binding transcriptional regulator AlpA
MALRLQCEEPRATSQPTDLLNLKTVCVFFGGPDSPLHAATIYRHIKRGLVPAPIKVGPNASRWLRSECEAALAAMIARRAEQ